MRFPGARRAKEADVGGLGDPRELRQVLHQRPLGRGLGGPVEVLERLQSGESGRADALARARGIAGEHLGLEQGLQEGLIGPALGASALGGRRQALGDPWRLQLGHQVGQPLAVAHRHSSA
jgi:hypothetical protein